MLNIVEYDINSASVLLSLERVCRGNVMTEVVSAVVVAVMVMVHYRDKVCKFLYLHFAYRLNETVWAYIRSSFYTYTLNIILYSLIYI
jgi:hypothetical protein